MLNSPLILDFDKRVRSFLSMKPRNRLFNDRAKPAALDLSVLFKPASLEIKLRRPIMERMYVPRMSAGVPSGVTLYTTLEPCTSRQHPKVPCATRVIQRRIARVVIGMTDPDSRVQGKGVHMLRTAGIDVDFYPNNLQKTVQELNRDFIALTSGSV
jgi:pyrimidine deaminase RibD-like protein